MIVHDVWTKPAKDREEGTPLEDGKEIFLTKIRTAARISYNRVRLQESHEGNVLRTVVYEISPDGTSKVVPPDILGN